MKAIDCLENALTTIRERGAVYKDSYLVHGDVMKAIFPDGVQLKTAEDFARWGVLNMQVSKLVRYTQSWSNPHIDSSHDLGVYSFIQEELDRAHKKKICEEIPFP